MPASDIGDILLTSMSGVAALPFATVTSALFRRVFTQPPFSVSAATLARQREYFPSRPGLWLTLAQTAATYLGLRLSAAARQPLVVKCRRTPR